MKTRLIMFALLFCSLGLLNVSGHRERTIVQHHNIMQQVDGPNNETLNPLINTLLRDWIKQYNAVSPLITQVAKPVGSPAARPKPPTARPNPSPAAVAFIIRHNGPCIPPFCGENG